MRVFAKASNMHPSGVGHVLPLGLEPDFHPPTGGSKKGGGAVGFPSPRTSAHLPLAGCVDSGHWAHAWWTSLYPLSPRSSDNRLTGLGTCACTACQHRSVMETVWLRCAMTLSRYPGAHYTRAPAASQHGSVS